MFYNNTAKMFEQASEQLEKENYIADMLVRTLYSNDVAMMNVITLLNYLKKKCLVMLIFKNQNYLCNNDTV